MSWLKRKSYPDFWNAYVACFSQAQTQDLTSIRFVVFDTETTGLNTKTDRILSIGCLGISNLQIKVSDQLEVYVKQEAFNAETVKIHGLLKAGKLTKIEELEAITTFLTYIKNAVLVAHHAAFDVAMINAVLLRHGLPKLKNKVLDTGTLFKKLNSNTQEQHFSLDTLAEQFKIPLHDRHTASGDAYITALLFLKILTKLKHKQPQLKFRDLERHKRIGLL